jgi:hypothetical protein
MEHHYNLLNREDSYKYINKIIDSLILKLLDVIISIRLVGLEDKDNPN